MSQRLIFWGGRMETTAREFELALQSRSESIVNYLSDPGIVGEVKKAFDALRVSIIGRPQRPRDDIASLLGWARRNEIAYACIQKKGQAAQDPELQVEQKKGQGRKETWEPIPGHPLRSLMNKPNALDDGASFLAAWLASRDIAGRFFAEIVLGDDGKPAALWPLHPGKVFPIPGRGKDGSNIIGWKFKDGNLDVDFKPEEILFDRNRDLASHFDATPPLAVALGAVDMDTAQTDFVRSFFNNGGVPSGILRFANRSLTAPEAEQKRQLWALRYGRGGVGERGIAVLDQGAEYQPIGSNIKELEADSLRGQSEARICMVFGVPPLLIGAYVGLKNVNQRASARESQKDFWDNTMSPTFKSLRSFLTWNLLPLFEGGLDRIRREEIRVGWDMSHVLALRNNEDEVSARAREEFRAGLITQNEGREAIGRDHDPNGDFYLVPSSFNPRTGEVLLSIAQKQPAEATPPGEDDADADPADEAGDDLEKIGRAFGQAKKRWALPPAPETGKAFKLDGLTLARAPEDWEAHLDLKAIADGPSKAGDRIKAALLGLRKGLIRQAVEALAELDPTELHTLVLVPPPRTYKKVRSELDQAYKLGRALVDAEAGRARAKAGFVPKDFKADWLDEEDEEFLDELTGTTVARVVNHVQAVAGGILATLSILGVPGPDRRKQLRERLDASSASPAEQAASSVANAAQNLGRDAEIESRSNEIERIIYSAILDVNTCEICEAADGQEADSVDELPPAPNDECQGGDKCRCFHVAVFAGEASDD